MEDLKVVSCWTRLGSHKLYCNISQKAIWFYHNSHINLQSTIFKDRTIHEFLKCTMPCLCRQVHLHWGQVPPGASDGLLPDPDVHTLPPHRHPVMGVLLDKHGCCTSQSGSGHHHCVDHDHTELWLKSFSTQGGCGGAGRASRDQDVTWLLRELDSLSPSVSWLNWSRRAIG